MVSSSNPYLNSLYTEEEEEEELDKKQQQQPPQQQQSNTTNLNTSLPYDVDDDHEIIQQNQDTFLSRIFGLNSIYNQLQDNYQYYDPEYDSNYHQQQRKSLLEDDENVNPGGNLNLHENDVDEDDERLFPNDQIPMDNLKNQKSNDNDNENKNKLDINSNSLLDSESDSDLSSSSDSYVRPHIPKHKLPKQRQSFNKPQEQQQIPSTTGQANPVESQQNTSSSKRPQIKFQVPQRVKSFVNRTTSSNNNDTIPLYNEQYRKPKQQQYANTNYKPTKLSSTNRRYIIPPKERALYLWANITNMDEFLVDIYYYYLGKGLLNIVTSRIVDLIILVFIIIFSIFLKWGIDYSKFWNKDYSKDQNHLVLSDLIISNFLWNLPFFIKFLVFGFFFYVLLRIIQLYFDYTRKFKEIQNFYNYLLGIEDIELMTISWKIIIEKLMLLKDYNNLTSSNPIENHYINDLSSKIRLNAHDIANRIMRKENYMIALLNKDILDFKILWFNEKTVLTKTLEWNLKLCIDNFIFNKQGQINGSILKEYNRNLLAKELTSRFKLASIINIILCPFLVIYFVLLYFFKYFNEYKSNPSSIIGLRQYTPYAEWKLREFNELPNFFNKRLQMSMGPANNYIDQFPKGFLIINGMKLINFISGSILAILVIMGIYMENEKYSFWSFEITEGKSVLFYISIFGTLWAITSSPSSTSANTSIESSSVSSSPQQTQSQQHFSSNKIIYDPESNIRYVSKFTHYLPKKWNKKLHTIQIKNEFCELYSLKIIIIINEILSVFLTPFLLYKFSKNSGNLIDFFRDYSIHVDGLGYVCYFAMFDFEKKLNNMNKSEKIKKKRVDKKKHKRTRRKSNETTPNESGSESDQYSDESDDDDEFGFGIRNEDNDKMTKSYMNFLENYGAGGYQQVANQNQSTNQSNSTKYQSNILNNQNIIDEENYFLFDNLNNTNTSENDNQIDNLNFKSKRKGGVLGMLNQFYKQDLNSNL
ncbi:ATG9 [Candida pseudojiufengensis]|uniref:ATG9 n=1 Tax=Candida pseudojiufengensis TaxID=497109 RepID=UPI0022257E4D|nr:ATG9 [Candida pseudojiufengensis]KAI5960975.1 ATG9 [Candida pseudojiufengensis]